MISVLVGQTGVSSQSAKDSFIAFLEICFSNHVTTQVFAYRLIPVSSTQVSIGA